MIKNIGIIPTIIKRRNSINLLINKFSIKIIKSEQEVSAVNLNKNDADLFKITEGYPAISNAWYLYDGGNKLVLIDQELTIRPLRVKNYYQ